MSARPFMDPAWAAIDPSDEDNSRIQNLRSSSFLDLCQILAYWPESLGCPSVHIQSDGSVHLKSNQTPHGSCHRYFILVISNRETPKFYEFGWDSGDPIPSHTEFTVADSTEAIDYLLSIYTHQDIPYDRTQPMT